MVGSATIDVTGTWVAEIGAIVGIWVADAGTRVGIEVGNAIKVDVAWEGPKASASFWPSGAIGVPTPF